MSAEDKLAGTKPGAYVETLFGLGGRTALVTGASSGIGRRLARALAAAGARVVAVARRQDALDTLVSEIEAAGGKAVAVPMDLVDGADLNALADRMDEPVRIILNGAGVNHRQSAEDITEATWDNTLSLNLKVPFFVARAFVPQMIEAGGGSIINVASLQSYRALKNGMAYGASKGGVAQLTRAMAYEWSGQGVRANAIAPGYFPTELTAPVFADEALAGMHAAATSIGRNGALPDLDGAAIFLASDASAYVTGAILPVDGGYLAR